MAYKVGIVGATGAVGQEFLELLQSRQFPIGELRLLASAKSAGKQVTFAGKTVTIEEARPEAFDDLDVALFSAGASVSKVLCPEAAQRGCVAIDNSSAFRMEPDVPLVVPEINPDAVREHKGIIANPNCSTAITLMGLYPLHREFGLKRFTAATYQAVSGTGVKGIVELESQLRAWAANEPLKAEAYPHQIAFNVIPQVDVFLENGYTKEEMKMLHESRKIMGLGDIAVSTTCVRVPVLRAHSIAVNAEFERPVDLARARAAITAFPGAEVLDDPANKQYPMPWFYSGKHNCGVGRLRKDLALDNGLAFWVVGDQILKGAALNAVQIAELMLRRGLLPKKA